MHRHLFAALGLVFASTAALAQSPAVGVATCDDFLTKYDACIASKVPAAQQATFKTQIDMMRKQWGEMAKTPQGKTQLEAMCKQTADQMKASMQPQGCAF